MIAESVTLVLGALFAILVARSPETRWLPWVLVGLGGLFVLLSLAIFFIPAPRVVPAFASGAVLFAAVGSRWKKVGEAGGLMGAVAAIGMVGWWIYGGGMIQRDVAMRADSPLAGASLTFSMDATWTFAVTTILAVEAVVIALVTRRRAATSEGSDPPREST